MRRHVLVHLRSLMKRDSFCFKCRVVRHAGPFVWNDKVFHVAVLTVLVAAHIAVANNSHTHAAIRTVVSGGVAAFAVGGISRLGVSDIHFPQIISGHLHPGAGKFLQFCA